MILYCILYANKIYKIFDPINSLKLSENVRVSLICISKLLVTEHIVIVHNILNLHRMSECMPDHF